jgi:hypothetical protein
MYIKDRDNIEDGMQILMIHLEAEMTLLNAVKIPSARSNDYRQNRDAKGMQWKSSISGHVMEEHKIMLVTLNHEQAESTDHHPKEVL